MNTKISEEQIHKTRNQVSDRAIIPGPKYFIILVTTIILLFSFSVAFCAVFIKQLIDVDVDVNDVDPPTNSVEGPVNPTIPKKPYISKSASDIQLVGDQVNSDNVILVDIDRNESIVEKYADDMIYPASMTKVMSVLVVCERAKNLNKKLTIKQKTINYAYSMEGSLYGIPAGAELTIKDLLYLTSYFSDTAAVLTLAEYIGGGSEAGFVKLMNEKAKAIGLKNTHFDNCTGLHSEENYSTCREMAAIFAYALDNSLCKKILTDTQPYKFTANESNYTIWSPSWYSQRVANDPNLETVTVKGGKTGYIEESGYCLVSYAEGKSGRRYIQVVIGDKITVVKKKEKIWYGNDVKFIYNNYAT